MGKYYPLVACSTFLCCLLLSCNKDQYAVEKPVYLSVPGFQLKDDVSQTGSNHSLITTGWVTHSGQSLGAFELPASLPVLMNEGENDITIYPGINLNGVSSVRAIHEFLEPFDTSITKPEEKDTVFLPLLRTRYTSNATVVILEDFDQAGLEFQPTSTSDTTVQKVSDSSLVFDPPASGRAGALYTTNSRKNAEVATANYYQLPQGGANVYLELSYRCNIPFAVGVIANEGSGVVKQPTVIVNAREDWNKIYINLVTEVSSLTSSNRFKIFIAALHQNDVANGQIYLDNIKLVY